MKEVWHWRQISQFIIPVCFTTLISFVLFYSLNLKIKKKSLMDRTSYFQELNKFGIKKYKFKFSLKYSFKFTWWKIYCSIILSTSFHARNLDEYCSSVSGNVSVLKQWYTDDLVCSQQKEFKNILQHKLSGFCNTWTPQAKCHWPQM